MKMNKTLARAIFCVTKAIEASTCEITENDNYKFITFDYIFSADIALIVQIFKDCGVDFYSYSYIDDNYNLIITMKK